jgi:hypothetical protein
MADTTFIDNNAPTVNASWLNDLNIAIYRALGSTGVAGGAAPVVAGDVLNNLSNHSVGSAQANFLNSLGGNLTAPLRLTTAANPPQFNSSANVATTTFVQNALGSLSNYQAINTTTTLSASSAGNEISVGGASTTITLPGSGTCTVGSCIIFRSASGATVTISAQGTDTLMVAGMTSAAAGSFTLQAEGDWVTFMSVGGSQWIAIALGKAPVVSVLTSGSSTYNTPFGAKLLKVRAVGGGGGGGGTGTASETAGGAGGSTTFGTATAPGGSGGSLGSAASVGAGGSGGAAPTNATFGFPGAVGSGGIGNSNTLATLFNSVGGIGGSSPFGGAGSPITGPGGAATTNTGSGGAGAGGGGGTSYPAGGGGAGTYMEIYLPNPATSYSYGVGGAGTGGTVGTGGSAGGAGAAGIIIIEAQF